jgi:hypothetical protein
MLAPNMWNSLGSSFGSFADLLMSEADRRRTAKENEKKLAKLEEAERLQKEREDSYSQGISDYYKTNPGEAMPYWKQQEMLSESRLLGSKMDTAATAGYNAQSSRDRRDALTAQGDTRLGISQQNANTNAARQQATASHYGAMEEQASKSYDLKKDQFEEQKEQFKKNLQYKYAALQTAKDRLELLKARQADNEYDYDDLEKAVADIKDYIATTPAFAQDPAFMEGNNKSLLSSAEASLKDKEKLLSRKKKPKAAAPPAKAKADDIKIEWK